jgi:hypothetical protein
LPALKLFAADEAVAVTVPEPEHAAGAATPWTWAWASTRTGTRTRTWPWARPAGSAAQRRHALAHEGHDLGFRQVVGCLVRFRVHRVECRWSEFAASASAASALGLRLREHPAGQKNYR